MDLKKIRQELLTLKDMHECNKHRLRMRLEMNPIQQEEDRLKQEVGSCDSLEEVQGDKNSVKWIQVMQL